MLHDAISAALPELRAHAESLMQDTAAVRRPGEKSAQSDSSWLEETTYSPLFTTRCKVTGGSSSTADIAARTVTIGGVEHVVLQGGVHVPIPAVESDEGDLREGDQLVITGIGPRTDPAVMGNVYQVVGFGGKSWATARRLDVVEV